MSFKAEIRVANDESFYVNALRFATHREAEAYALELFARWTLVVEWRVIESDDPVTHKIVGGHTLPIDDPG